MREPIEVCSLRDRGEPEDRDVVVTRPGPWGNPYTLAKHGFAALDKYREELVIGIRLVRLTHGSAANWRGREWLDALRDLAGKRRLCACPSGALACHAWILAEEVSRLTGCGVAPAPGRSRP